MCRTSVSRIVLAMVALSAAFAAPAAALAHGYAHHAESAAQVGAAAAVAPGSTPLGGGSAEPGAAEPTHPELHAPNVAPRLGQIAPSRPAIRADDLAAHFSTSAATFDPTTPLRYISPHSGPTSQPRAPPLR